LQDTLSNLFAGIHILASHNIHTNDYVKLPSGEEGYISDITWRNTVIRTMADNIVIVPNTQISASVITNFSHPSRKLYAGMPFALNPEIDLNLAENIIRWGKVIYLTQAALPKFEPAVILRYTENDYKWAIDNEYSIWKYLVDEKLLFKSDDRTKLNLLKEGPYTVGLSEKGPDRLGQFLGFRIIQKFMEVRKCTVEEMLNSSYSDILVEYEID
jgi:hypothetical protein